MKRPRSMPKWRRDALQAQLIALAVMVGPRAAARQLDINEDTASHWWWRANKDPNHKLYRFNTHAIQAQESTKEAERAIESIQQAMKQRSEATKLQFAVAADNASSHLATMPSDQLVQRDVAQSADAWGKVGDRAHGWSAERAKAPVVQVANITMPSEAQEAANRATDERLDRITALLQSTATKTL